MPDIYLNVPFVTQMNIGGHVPGRGTRDDPTGCWYASISMLGYYREQGPRLGVPSLYVNPDGTPQKTDAKGNVAAKAIGGVNYDTLVANEGLTAIPLPANKTWTCEKLAEILRDCGPCFIRRGFRKNGVLTGGHAIVLVGARTSDNKVVCHCPTRGPDQEYTIVQFNDFFKWDDPRAAKNSMMVKLPTVGGMVRQRANAMSVHPPTRPRANAIGSHRGGS